MWNKVGETEINPLISDHQVIKMLIEMILNNSFEIKKDRYIDVGEGTVKVTREEIIFFDNDGKQVVVAKKSRKEWQVINMIIVKILILENTRPFALTVDLDKLS